MDKNVSLSITPTSPSVEYTGRWEVTESYAAATACGSSFRIAFCGRGALLSFDVSHCQSAFPHIYISVDGGAAIECAVDNYIRIWSGDGVHEATVTVKSALEPQDRWLDPVAQVVFLGVAEAVGAQLLPDERPVIEFVGDSITEGNSSYPYLTPIEGARWIDNLVYTNDIASSYSYLTAKLLGWRGAFFGYGSTGVADYGGGGVPRLADAYGYIRDGVEYRSHADHVVINSGTNDRGETPEHFIKCYKEAIDVIREKNPGAILWIVQPFCGAFGNELRAICSEYNGKGDTNIIFVSTDGWAPPEPLHPLYETSLSIAEKLADVIKNYFA